MLLTGKRVFVVEDNFSSKAIAQTLLEREGATVFADAWGMQTIMYLKVFGPMDVILLDLVLPGQVSGFDVFKEIHQIHQFAKTPIVAVSGMDPTRAIPQAQTLGFAGFISKPIDFVCFAKQIKQILSGESLWITSENL